MQEICGAVKADATFFVMATFNQAKLYNVMLEVESAVRPLNSPILFLGSMEKFNNFEAFHAPEFVSTLPGYTGIPGRS